MQVTFDDKEVGGLRIKAAMVSRLRVCPTAVSKASSSLVTQKEESLKDASADERYLTDTIGDILFQACDAPDSRVILLYQRRDLCVILSRNSLGRQLRRTASRHVGYD